jgi:hypothetical protein
MRGPLKPLLATALALLLATAPGACGGDGSGDSTAGSTTTATTAKKPEEPDAGSASFLVPGGDNSVQNYGEEAGAAEREAASDVVVAFLRAREKGDWKGVCAHIYTDTLKPLEAIAERGAEFEGEGCPELLALLTRGAPASARASTIGSGINSLRVDGDRAFALYHGTDGRDYLVPLVDDDGEWKVGTLAPTELAG